MRYRIGVVCAALGLTVLRLLCTVLIAEAGGAQAVTVLTITCPKQLIVGEESSFAVSLVSKTPARSKPVPDEVVHIYVDDMLERRIRTDENGIAAFPMRRDLSVGSHTIRAVYNGSGWLYYSQTTTTLVIKPAEVEIHTVPPLADVRFSLAGRTFISDQRGVARIEIEKAGIYHLEVLPWNNPNSDTRAEFVRWGDEVFSSARQVRVPLKKPLIVGLNVSYRASQHFVDLTGQPVDPERISSLILKGSDGVKYTFTDGQSKWMQAGRIVERIGGIEESKIQYSLGSVEIDGSNAVIEAAQRFYMTQPNDVWSIKLRLYSASFTARDALFHFPAGSGVELEYPDGRKEELSFDHRMKLETKMLAPGIYHVRVLGARGIAPPTPLAMSRNQDVELIVLSHFDLTVMFSLMAALALGLLFFGRPHLVTILFNLPFHLFRRRRAKRLHKVSVLESLYTSAIMQCPSCQATLKQSKAGFNRSGSQRYRCQLCGRAYTPLPRPIGYSSEIRTRAIKMYLEGNSRRTIGRILKVNPKTVSHWIADHTIKLPPAIRSSEVPELDRQLTDTT